MNQTEQTLDPLPSRAALLEKLGIPGDLATEVARLDELDADARTRIRRVLAGWLSAERPAAVATFSFAEPTLEDLERLEKEIVARRAKLEREALEDDDQVVEPPVRGAGILDAAVLADHVAGALAPDHPRALLEEIAAELDEIAAKEDAVVADLDAKLGEENPLRNLYREEAIAHAARLAGFADRIRVASCRIPRELPEPDRRVSARAVDDDLLEVAAILEETARHDAEALEELREQGVSLDALELDRPDKLETCAKVVRRCARVAAALVDDLRKKCGELVELDKSVDAQREEIERMQKDATHAGAEKLHAEISVLEAELGEARQERDELAREASSARSLTRRVAKDLVGTLISAPIAYEQGGFKTRELRVGEDVVGRLAGYVDDATLLLEERRAGGMDILRARGSREALLEVADQLEAISRIAGQEGTISVDEWARRVRGWPETLARKASTIRAHVASLLAVGDVHLSDADLGAVNRVLSNVAYQLDHVAGCEEKAIAARVKAGDEGAAGIIGPAEHRTRARVIRNALEALAAGARRSRERVAQEVRAAKVEAVTARREVDAIREAFEPVYDWFAGGGEEPDPPLASMVSDAVRTLQEDRRELLSQSAKHTEELIRANQARVRAEEVGRAVGLALDELVRGVGGGDRTTVGATRAIAISAGWFDRFVERHSELANESWPAVPSVREDEVDGILSGCVRIEGTIEANLDDEQTDRLREVLNRTPWNGDLVLADGRRIPVTFRNAPGDLLEVSSDDPEVREQLAGVTAEDLLVPAQPALCRRCGLPANVHGHGETGMEDSHPFEDPREEG